MSSASPSTRRHIQLAAGDSIYYAGDCAHAFDNPGDEHCIYYLAMDVSGAVSGRRHVANDGGH